MRKPALLALAFLCGCGNAGRLDLVMGDDRNSTHGPAVVDAARAFVEGPTSARGPSASASAASLIDIDPDFLSPNGDVNRQLTTNVGLGLRHQSQFALGRRSSVYTSTTAALGKTRYHLPDGVGVLTDPTRVALTSFSLQPEVGLARDWEVGGDGRSDLLKGRLTTSVGVGVQLSTTRTTIRSALLDVDHRSLNAQPYVALGVAMQPVWTPLGLDLQARIARDGMTQIRTDLTMPLGRARP